MGTDAPPDLMAHTRDRLAEVAADSAKNAAERKLRSTIKGYVPKVLWPLIPGEGGSVSDNLRAAGKKWFWGVVSSIVISVIFFGLFAMAFVGFGLVVVYALVTS